MGQNNSLIHKGVALQGVYACSDETMLKAKELAAKTFLTMHLNESQSEVYSFLRTRGKRPAEHVSALGIMDERFIAVHCLFLTKKEIDALKGSNVVHCPSSNLKLANGVAPIPELAAVGTNVVLGTDSTATNNSLNMFAEMRLSALLHKSTHWDPSILGHESCFRMATQNATKALDLKSGAIEEGKLADIALVDKRSV
jgi:5-methylthioadenosine/S-adenosylhomocysteine deaminase